MSHDHGAHHHITTASTTSSPPIAVHHNHHDEGHTSAHSDHAEGHHMIMYFHGGCTEIILFNCWRIESFTGLILSSLLVFFMAAAYEGIKWFRVYYQMCCATPRSAHAHRQQFTLSEVGQSIEDALIQNSTPTTITTATASSTNNGIGPGTVGTLSNDVVYVPTVAPGVRKTNSRIDAFGLSFHQLMHRWALKSSNYLRIVESFLYGLQLVIAYFLMLIAMTYNVYLFAAVVVGAAFGHWLFAGLKCVLTPSPLLSHATNVDRADNFASDACH